MPHFARERVFLFNLQCVFEVVYVGSSMLRASTGVLCAPVLVASRHGHAVTYGGLPLPGVVYPGSPPYSNPQHVSEAAALPRTLCVGVAGGGRRNRAPSHQ